VYAPLNRAAASRAGAPAVCLEIPAQRESPAKLQKPERESTGIGDQCPQLAVWYVADFGEWADACTKQHFVLDDVAHASEDGLIEQDICDLGARKCLDLFERSAPVPLVGHHVARKIVRGLRVRVFHELEGGGPHRDLPIGKGQHQARSAAASVVACDRSTCYGRREGPPQHEVDAKCERFELKDEMLSPRENLFDAQTGQPLDADSAVAGDGCDSPAGERLQLFGRQKKRRAFHAGYLE
jgi:hypothetical protein